MTTFLKQLAIQRQKFIDGLDANKDDINLDIFEDFYPDRAHFIFELLQNAEDAGATEAAVTLTATSCVFEHNGTRTFTEGNVRAITGIHNSTKTKAADQIGKFGVGFKSVFVYTLTPIIHSGDFAFKITRLVLPEPVDPLESLGQKTRFTLPFNTPKKTPEEAFTEIAAGLNGLAETTLLFLPQLQLLRWHIDGGEDGEVRRIQHSRHHYEVLKRVGRQTGISSHFLKFDEPVEGLEQQRIAAAFALDFLPEISGFEATKPLAQQMKIVPATPGRVAVFFPAEKETSGLRFHLHAPFVPELSRASIKETPANHPLFAQLATLVANSLHEIRDYDLLTIDFLGVLPNAQDNVAERYRPIQNTIIAAMKTQALTPTHLKSHAPAKSLLQAKATLKELLSERDLSFLVPHSDGSLQWCVGATQKNTHVDRFLANLQIREWDIRDFVKLLSERTSTGARWVQATSSFVYEPDAGFMNWLAGKTPEWHQRLYGLLYTELNPNGACRQLRGRHIVRLANGTYTSGDKSFFPTGSDDAEDGLPRVDMRLYTAGKSKTQQEAAKKFLQELGVREVGEAEQVEALLRQRYTSETFKPRKQDLKRFVALLEKDSTKASLFEQYFIFEGRNGLWRRPDQLFLDAPFLPTGLAVYHDALGKESGRIALTPSYIDGPVSVKRLVQFAAAVGTQRQLSITEVSCSGNPQYLYLRSAPGERRTSPINRDYTIAGLEKLLASPTVGIAKLIWHTMSSVQQSCLRATYRKNESGGALYAPSQLVHHLRNASWIPQEANRFVRPKDAARDLLPEGFAFDPGAAWLKAIGFAEEATKRSEEQRHKELTAKSYGFTDAATLERAKRFAALPSAEQERILAHTEARPSSDLPEHEPTNPERRAARVGLKAAEAPPRLSEERVRAVPAGKDQVKEQATQYLLQQYTNGDGDLICQICKDQMPFKLNDGTEYFETVEFIPGLQRRHYQNYIALCPNHAAMFRHANNSADAIEARFLGISNNELDVVLAREESTIYFTKTHIADLKEVIKVDRQDAEQAKNVVVG